MSVGLTVEERVIQDVLDTLGEINGLPEFNTTVRVVRRQEAAPTTVQAWPAIIVVHSGNAGSGEDGEGGFNNTVTRKLRLLVYGCVNGTQDATWPAALQLLASDIENALRVDLQRGTSAGQPNAHMTAIANAAIFDQTEMGTVGVAAVELLVLVTYRHVLRDTTIAI